MNVISFSLYGNKPKYDDGFRANFRLAKEIYPGWKVWVYSTGLVYNIEADRIIMMQGNGSHPGLFWRFNPAFDSSVDRMIVRDADSRLNWKEKAAVDEWIESGKPFHCMRDHDQHTVPIMGGMWGCIPSKIKGFKDAMDKWTDFEMDGDQKFLRHHVWPSVREKCICHTSHIERDIGYHGPHDARPFPPHKETTELFVGQPHGDV